VYFVPDVEVRDAAALLAPVDESAPLVAIVDTGLLANHPLLKPRLVASRDFTASVASDIDGHGTEVALLLVISAPDVRLLSAKVLADDAASVEVQARRLAAGIDWAVAQGAREINICVGFVNECAEEHADLCRAVRAALDKNVFVLVAGEARCPATCDSRILVIGELETNQTVRSNVPPSFVDNTPGRVRMLAWNDWLQTAKRGE
jgi:hypothetical protein